MSEVEEPEVIACEGCGAEYARDSYCAECGYGETGELIEGPPQPVYYRIVEPQPMPVHEPAWCPYCLAWLGTWPSKAEARAYERALTDHPIEFCQRRAGQVSGSEEWRLRSEAGKSGSLAASRPIGPRPLRGAK